MKMNEAREILVTNGVSVEERTVTKGSCVVDALTIGDGSIKPSFYERTLENVETEEELMKMVNKITKNIPNVNVDRLRDAEYVQEHCISCIRHETDDNSTIKWSIFGDLEEYIRINLGSDEGVGNMSCVVTETLLDQLNMDADELRSHARRNLREHATITGMREVLRGLTGQDLVGDMEEMMFVGTVDTMSHGASVMLLDDMLEDFCRKHGIDAVTIIPCSVNEILLIPGTTDDEAIDEIIHSVNVSEVDEWDQLSSHCYHWSMPVAA